MKKITLAIFSFFVLVACSEDVYHDIDKQNNGLETGNNPDSEGSGGNAPFTYVPGSPPYESPWNVNDLLQVEYVFENLTGDWGSPYLLTFSVTPYVGLAYYDGVDAYDADYFGTALDPFNYPNLYPAPGSSEIGQFIPALPIVVDGTGLPYTAQSVVLQIKPDLDHLPLNNVISIPFIYNPTSINFVLPPPPGGVPITPDEDKLLSEYGKVFFYFCEAIDPVTNMVVWSGYMMPNAPYTPAYWFGTSVAANIPGVGPSVPLVYNLDSQEVVLNSTFIPVGLYSSAFGPFVHNGVSIYAEVKTDATSMTVSLRP